MPLMVHRLHFKITSLLFPNQQHAVPFQETGLRFKCWRIAFINVNPHSWDSVFEVGLHGPAFMRCRAYAANPLAWFWKLAVIVTAGKRADGQARGRIGPPKRRSRAGVLFHVFG